MRYILLLFCGLVFPTCVFCQNHISGLFDLSKKEISEFYIEKGSRGCFHREEAKRSYIRKQGQFVFDQSTSSNDFLPGAPGYIKKQTIHQLVSAIDSSQSKLVSITDMNLTQQDIVNFKKFIDSEEQRIKKHGIDFSDDENLYFFPEENADFAFYKNVADSLMTLPTEIINQAFRSASDVQSTTTKWRKITFVFEDKTKLVVENSDYIPNYLYVPWIVNYEGVEFKSNSIVFGKLLHQLTGNDFFGNTDEKNYAIFKIAEYVYRAQFKTK
jgi:hypothetical protein